MIKKTIISAVLIFIMYNVFLHVVQPDWLPFPQGQEQTNLIKAEEYIYNENTKDYVLVGTSLTGRFVTDKIYNLAFGGGSVLTGLEIIEASKKTPKIIFIEANRFYKEVEPTIADKVLDPIKTTTNSILPSFQTKNNPVSLAIAATRFLITGQKKNTSEYSNTYNKKLKAIKLRNKKENYKKKNELELWESSGKQLVEAINKLSKKGTKIAFYELPIDPELSTSSYVIERRQFIKTLFPKEAYYWVPDENPSEYETTDGSHLVPRDCKKYNRLLNNSIPKVLAK